MHQHFLQKSSLDKNMGCEERLSSAFMEKTKVEMALHRNLKTQKETENALSEKIQESQNLFDENSQLKIAIENNSKKFEAEKKELETEIEKVEKELEELRNELKIHNGKENSTAPRLLIFLQNSAQDCGFFKTEGSIGVKSTILAPKQLNSKLIFQRKWL